MSPNQPTQSTESPVNLNSRASAIFHDVGILVNRTIDYQNKIKTAKTKAKVDYYYKKLVKNNKILEVLLPLAEKIRLQEIGTATPQEPPRLDLTGDLLQSTISEQQ